ncbi:MAG: hypothetical protein A2Z21_10210 [Candidatus Fraserbacteria bacterium RBG_16_55_9]|uniref:Hydroxymethylglutaryl-CoA synthase n=1 Tax=Fraserbacteria sp. (strain RBG_16_55_9) TaxID=1817864 RepID=A0A1F5UNB0_FRAXR|nr:MAG: hypothetical protein A2Z21_10210 [Candidatus Fraserbacteria bacterium RBG_16_55_9]
MVDIASYGVYVPRYRIKAEEINQAWGRSGGRGEKAVAAPDEDVLTMGVKAARAALMRASLDGAQVEAVYFASISSGYAENALAAQLAGLLGANQGVSVADFGLSTRSVTSALQACTDAMEAGRIGCGLVIASDRLIAKPGSDYELSYAAGAAALVLAKEGFASLGGFSAYSSGFVGRSRAEGQFHGTVDERFVMQQGFLEHISLAIQDLTKVMNITLDQFGQVVLHAPDLRWGNRALAQIGLDPKKHVSTFAQIGYAGCASFLVDLAYALEKLTSLRKILAVSYGPGGSDALALSVEKQPSKMHGLMTVEEQLNQKEHVSYSTYLRYSRLLGGPR